MTGETILGFEILHQLGSGGMGSVYEALDLTLKRRVAIKVMNPELSRDRVFSERFRKEALALASLSHPNVTAVYSLFQHAEQLFLVMELVDGEQLDQMVRTRGALPWPEAVEITCEILDGLEHAHARGIVHRDVKPSNCLLTTQGKVKITDFGIAYVAGRTRLTRSGKVIGTAEYIAPELIMGRVPDRRADVYSTGAMLYELVTGRMPFLADNVQDLVRAQLETPPLPPRTIAPQLPENVEHVILRALAKDPNERFQSAAEMAAALRAEARPSALHGSAPHADRTEILQPPAPPPPPPLPSAGGGSRWLLGATALLSTAAVAIVGWTLLTGPEDAGREDTVSEPSATVQASAPPPPEPVAAPVAPPQEVPQSPPEPVADPALAPPPPPVLGASAPETRDPSRLQICQLAARLGQAARRLHDRYRGERGAGDELLGRLAAFRAAVDRLQEACTGTEPRGSVRQRAVELRAQAEQLAASFPRSGLSVSTEATWLMIQDRLGELDQTLARQ